MCAYTNLEDTATVAELELGFDEHGKAAHLAKLVFEGAPRVVHLLESRHPLRTAESAMSLLHLGCEYTSRGPSGRECVSLEDLYTANAVDIAASLVAYDTTSGIGKRHGVSRCCGSPRAERVVA